MDGRHVVVVGGGVGGVTTALLLAELGARVTLLERIAAPKAVGAGIMLQPNGLAVLYGLGLRDALARGAHRLASFGTADERGHVIVRTAVPDFGRGLDHVLVLRRSHLFSVLADAAAAHPAIDARFGLEVESVTPEGTVTFRDGASHSLRADLVVGADGVHSCVRSHGHFGARLRRGAWYLRGLAAPTPVEPVTEYWTRLGIFGAAPVVDGTYFYSSTEAPPLKDAVARGDLGAFRDAWAEALPLAARVVGAVERFEDLLVNQVIRVDCGRFFDGRLVLVGDAAHAMAPNLAQGANSALVDAAVLAWELGREPDQHLALERYDRRRRAAVRLVQDGSERLSKLSEMTQPWLRRLRDALMRALTMVVDSARMARAVQQEEPAWLEAAAERRERWPADRSVSG
jgi:2-polyprenyl-6-methoxyphenol hydroxylase-like FAD-dependent oxidoreductase